MAVRVKIRIEFKKGPLVTAALANSGYEARQPELLIPERLAVVRCGSPPIEARQVHTAGGTTQFLEYGEVTVGAVDAKKEVRARLYSSSFENEVIMNDVLCGELGIVLLDLKEGEWRFKDDPPSMVRNSEPRMTY